MLAGRISAFEYNNEFLAKLNENNGQQPDNSKKTEEKKSEVKVKVDEEKKKKDDEPKKNWWNLRQRMHSLVCLFWRAKRVSRFAARLRSIVLSKKAHC